MESVKLTASDGYELCLNIYEAQKPKACIQILHGMEEHQGRYRDFAGMLAAAGYTAITSDMRGHGANAPVFGFFKEKNGWKYLLDDQKRITAYIRERYGVEKIAVFAHSMGTIIARNLLQCESHNYSKVILSGYPYCPAILPLGIFLAKTIKAFRGPEYVSTWMQTLALGDFNLKLGETKTEYDWLSANEKNVQSYIEDPLCGHVFTISGFCDLFALLRNMNNPDNYKNINESLPILAIRGEEDASTGYEKGSRDSITTLTKMGFSNISRIVYKGMRHELINETEKSKVYKDILSFLKDNNKHI